MFEEISHNGYILALLLRTEYKSEGIHFFTPDEFTQQLGYMNREKGYKIQPHVHRPVLRKIKYTKEVILIKSGKVRVDFFSEDQTYLESRILHKGDIILLAYGGHGFEMLEDSEIVEVKQGPYAGDADKTRFPTIDASDLIIKE